MSDWKSVKAKRLLSALLKIGWRVKRQTGRIRFWSASAGLMLSLHFMTTMKLALKCWREWRRSQACSQKICKQKLRVFATRSFYFDPEFICYAYFFCFLGNHRVRSLQFQAPNRTIKIMPIIKLNGWKRTIVPRGLVSSITLVAAVSVMMTLIR